MSQITAAMVKELRDATGVGMMECKKALVESGGDKDQALRLLRERGVAIAGKKASRAANEGLVKAAVSGDAQVGAMIEVNCETDFVARNEDFQAFVSELADRALEMEDGTLAETTKDEVSAKVAEIGENIVVGKNVRFEAQGTGAVFSYIHLGGKVGVLLEMGCEKGDSVGSDAFQAAAKDITLHIAACTPQYMSRDEVPAETVESEKAIFVKQVEGKPENIIDNIVKGKLNKFYSQICLEEQPFVRDDKVSVTKYLEACAKDLGDTFKIRRYTRYQIG